MKKKECFKIRLYATKEFDIENPCVGDVIYNVRCANKQLTGNPVDIVADPFLFVKDSTFYLFYEDKRLRRKGVLSMVSTKNLVKWSKPVVVLKEPFHLSYPFVFEEDGHVYMLPETNEAKSINLYEAKDSSLSGFERKHILLKDEDNDGSVSISFCDTSIHKKEGVYYMHTTRRCNGVNTLELYTSDSLFGPYVKHPSSPILADNKYGRNAGSLISIGDTLYRVAQDCVKQYGDNVHLFRIDELTPNSYRETLVKDNILNIDIPFYKEGGHQLNVVRFQDKYIVATDAKEYHTFFLSAIIYKIRRIFHLI